MEENCELEANCAYGIFPIRTIFILTSNVFIIFDDIWHGSGVVLFLAIL